MIRSIRYFLLVSLLLSITIASAINGIGNYLLDEHVIQPFLDSQLVRISSILQLLHHSTNVNPVLKAQIIGFLHETQPLKSENFLFQVWSKDGRLLMFSSNVLHLPLKDAPLGFSNKQIEDNEWRIYATYNEVLGTKIIVAELYNLRRELADDIARSNANILLVTYPVFALLVWAIVTFALRSITRVTSEISNRASTYLEPVQLTSIPIEIKPLVGELNQLFIRLKLAFERNKQFAGDAAHELRTPLAAIKTHAQVALKGTNLNDCKMAIHKIIESVDRSSHSVAQLLILSRLGEEESLTDVKPINLHKLAIEMIAYIAPFALEKNIEIELDPPPPNAIVWGNDAALGILVRNITDNAIRYTPPNGAVKIAILETEDAIILRVIDTGPGVPIELRERIFERFYRILGTKALGSGLGLAIVSQIAMLHHAEITLKTPENGIGLQFDVAFPKYHG